MQIWNGAPFLFVKQYITFQTVSYSLGSLHTFHFLAPPQGGKLAKKWIIQEKDQQSKGTTQTPNSTP